MLVGLYRLSSLGQTNAAGPPALCAVPTYELAAYHALEGDSAFGSRQAANPPEPRMPQETSVASARGGRSSSDQFAFVVTPLREKKKELDRKGQEWEVALSVDP